MSKQPPVPKGLRKTAGGARTPVAPSEAPRGEGWLCGPTDPVAALPEWMSGLLGTIPHGFEALRRYLRDFSNIGGGPAYDTNGVLMLFLALADNLRECPEAAADLPALAASITPEQAALLAQLARLAGAPAAVNGHHPA